MASANTTVFLGDGEHPARLGIEGARELQDKTGTGPYALLRRIASGDWRIDDLRETIRIGLIGGGMTPNQAHVLTIRYCDNRPWSESVMPALKILDAAIHAEEPVKAPGDGDDVEADDGKIAFSKIIGLGVLMGFTPQQVGAMSLDEFRVAAEAFAKSQGHVEAPSGAALEAAELAHAQMEAAKGPKGKGHDSAQ